MERPWWRHPYSDADQQGGSSHGAETRRPRGKDDDRTRRQPQQHATDLGRGVAGAQRHHRRPAAGGRRRRRRGDTDSISVAELTGEIPIVTDHDITDRGRWPSSRRGRAGGRGPSRRARRDQSPTSPADAEPVELNSLATSNGVVEHRRPSERRRGRRSRRRRRGRRERRRRDDRRRVGRRRVRRRGFRLRRPHPTARNRRRRGLLRAAASFELRAASIRRGSAETPRR